MCWIFWSEEQMWTREEEKPVTCVPFYFDFYRQGCVNVCLEMPMAVPARATCEHTPLGSDGHTNKHYVHMHTCTLSEIQV